MVSKLSQNGVEALLLANGVEKQIRKQLIENDLVEAIIILPRNMFYFISNLKYV
ncbi:hypothetical protein F280043A3_13940 [Intestinibacter bartlettii]